MKAGSISPVSDLTQAVNSIKMQGNVDSYADAKTGNFQMYLTANTGKSPDFDSMQSGKPDGNVKAVRDDGKADFSQHKENAVKDKIADSGNVNKSDAVCDDKTVAKADSQIRDAIKKELGLTDEELDAALAQLGFSIADLLMPQNVAAFVAEVNNTDVMSIVADSELTEQLTDVIAAINDAFADASQQLEIGSEQLAEAIKQNAGSEVAKDNGASKDSNMPERTEAIDETVAKQPEYVVVKDENTGKEIKVTVENDKVVDSDTVQYAKVPENAQTSSDEHSDRRQNNSERGSAHSFAQNLVQNLTQAVADTVEGVQSFTEGYTVNAADVINQVIEAIRVNVHADTSSMELQLNPESLGKINLNVAAKDGVVTATITAQNEAVKGIIESQLVQLKESLNNQGLKVQSVEVAVANHGFDLGQNSAGQEHNGRQGARSGRRYRSLDDYTDDDIDVSEALEQRIMEANGNSVSYTA